MLRKLRNSLIKSADTTKRSGLNGTPERGLHDCPDCPACAQRAHRLRYWNVVLLAYNRGIQRRDRGFFISDPANPRLWRPSALVVACLIVNQMAYLAGVFGRSSGLFQKQADKEPSQRGNNNVAGKPGQQQEAPSCLT